MCSDNVIEVRSVFSLFRWFTHFNPLLFLSVRCSDININNCIATYVFYVYILFCVCILCKYTVYVYHIYTMYGMYTLIYRCTIYILYICIYPCIHPSVHACVLCGYTTYDCWVCICACILCILTMITMYMYII